MKQFVGLLFFLIFLGILTAAIIYLSRRMSWYFSIPDKKLLYITFASLTIFMIFGVLALSNSTSSVGNIFYVMAATTMGLMLYLLFSVLLVDLLSLFTGFAPRIYGISVLSITLIFSIYGIWNARDLKVTQHEIGIKGLEREIRAMHLSDLHLGHLRGKDFLQRIVDKTNQQDVDVVFITGDLFDGRFNLSMETLAPLTQLSVPVYFIEGNHDRYTGVTIIKDYLRQLDVNVLENESRTWNGLQIIGLDHMLADSSTYNMHAAGHISTIKSTLENLRLKQDMPTILLHHSPDGVQYANQAGVDLYLAGHTHAGQLFPITYIAGMMFAYNKGLHDYNGTKIFVSQGAGTFGPPMRVGTRSEIGLLSLKPVI